jgi:hypothetical protein
MDGLEGPKGPKAVTISIEQRITTQALTLTLRNCAYLHTKMLDLSSVVHVDLFPEKMG